MQATTTAVSRHPQPVQDVPAIRPPGFPQPSTRQPAADRAFRRFLQVFVYSSLWSAGGLAALTLFAGRLLGLGASVEPPLLILFSAMFVYNLDHVIDARVQDIPDEEAERYFRHPLVLVLLVCCGIATGLLAGGAPLAVKGVFAGYMSVGLLYGLAVVPMRRAGGIRWIRLKDIPWAKSWMVAGAVTWAVIGLPLAWAGRRPTLDAAYLAVFLYVFVVSNVHMFDVRDLATDRERHVATLPATLGVRGAKRLVLGLNLALLALMAWGWGSGLTAPYPELLVATVATVLYVMTVSVKTPRTFYGIVVDGCLYLPALLLVVRDVILE